MAKMRTQKAGATRHTLQVVGEMEEFGTSENVYRFEACLSGPDSLGDVSTIHGLLIRHYGKGDLCIKIHSASDGSIHCKPVTVHEGAAASARIEIGVDVQVRLQGRDILYLHTPRMLNANAREMPGTRLIAALQRHYDGRDLDVVVDLGTDEESVDFRRYFFPQIDLLGFYDHSSYLLLGRWGAPKRQGDAFSLGIVYDDGPLPPGG